MAFFDMVSRGGHTAIVNNAAASALGRMIARLGRARGIAVINIVRRQEQVDLLKAFGTEHVLNSSTAAFAEGLTNQEIAQALQLTVDTVKIRLHRARTRLKNELGTGCNFYRDERNELACDPKPHVVFLHRRRPSTGSTSR